MSDLNEATKSPDPLPSVATDGTLPEVGEAEEVAAVGLVER